MIKAPYLTCCLRSCELEANWSKQSDRLPEPLNHPRLSISFKVEGKVLKLGIGAVVSQQGNPPYTFHMLSCAYFSHNISPSNQELLAIKHTLEVWWHWLKAAVNPRFWQILEPQVHQSQQEDWILSKSDRLLCNNCLSSGYREGNADVLIYPKEGATQMSHKMWILHWKTCLKEKVYVSELWTICWHP